MNEHSKTQKAFSPSTQAFYDLSFDYPDLPNDLVELDEPTYQTLFTQLNQGCHINNNLSASEPRPSQNHLWLPEKQAWHLSPEAQQQQLQAEKSSKLAILNHTAQNQIAQIAGTDKIPEFELQSWSLQAIEAKAWAADKSAATPILDTIAANRKIPRELLIQAALNKTLQYEALTAAVAGQRQALQTQIEAAQNLEDLNAIEIAFRQPETETKK